MSDTNNDAVIRRLQARMAQSGRNVFPSPLGDYPAELPNRILVTKGLMEQGPISTPIKEGGTVASDYPACVCEYLKKIYELLDRMPESLSNEFRRRFFIVPREALSFVAPGGPILLAVPPAPLSSQAIVSETVQEMFTGVITGVGVNVIPAGAFADVIWQIRVNGAVHPLFANRVYSASTLSNPDLFPFEIPQNRTVQLVAINNGIVPVSVAGKLVGYTEYLTEYKKYGSVSASGIA